MRANSGESVSTSTGFSDVDASGRSDELIDYLAFLANRLGEIRREGFELLEIRPGNAALDVGCGAGEVCVELASWVGPQGRVAGVDLSEVMVEKAKRTAANAGLEIDLRVATADQLPFADQSFDVVRAERVFQHLEKPEAALREMLRVTKVGGRILLMDPDHGQANLAVDDVGERRVFEALRRALLRAIINPHSGARLRPMVQRAGLGAIQHRIQALELAYPDFGRAFFLNDLIASAMTAGEVTRTDAVAFVASLENRHRAGTFFSSAVGYTVVGTRLE